MAHIIPIFRQAWNFEIRGPADNSLSQPTYRCRRTKSIVSFDTEICSCGELHVSSFYRDLKKISRDSHDFRNMKSRAANNFFLARQGAEGDLRHFDRNMRRTCTIVCDRQNVGGPVLTLWFFHLYCASSCTNQNSDHLGDY
jgi:hypothetical protein